MGKIARSLGLSEVHFVCVCVCVCACVRVRKLYIYTHDFGRAKDKLFTHAKLFLHKCPRGPIGSQWFFID